MSTYTILLASTTVLATAAAGWFAATAQLARLRVEISGLKVTALEHDARDAENALEIGRMEVQRHLEKIGTLEGKIADLHQQITDERALVEADEQLFAQGTVGFDNGTIHGMNFTAVEHSTVVSILAKSFGRDNARAVVKALFERDISFHRQTMLVPEPVMTEAELNAPRGAGEGEAA